MVHVARENVSFSVVGDQYDGQVEEADWLEYLPVRPQAQPFVGASIIL